ncbi:MAG TPA: hypothetical protein VF020_01010 [Chthoniobacterales bacterium]
MKESSWSPEIWSLATFATALVGRKSRVCPAILLILTACGQFAYGQSIDEINKREEAVRQAWVQTPLSVRRALFVTDEPGGFGVYTPRSSSRFKAGEKMIVYAEPVGYLWKSLDDGQYEFGVKVDLIVKTPAGKVLAEKDDFGNLVLKSRAKNTEFLIHLDVNLNGAPTGDYVLAFRLHDAESDKTTTIELPVTLE